MKTKDVTSPEQINAALTRVLSSETFTRAPGLKRFLDYICSEAVHGRGEGLKEYNIAVEGLGRPPGFDQKKDSIVRVQALKLRKRLEEYYEGEGAQDPVRIILSEGSYLPEFHFTDAGAASSTQPQQHAGAPAVPPEPSAHGAGQKSLLVRTAVSALLLLGAGLITWRFALPTAVPAQKPRPAEHPAPGATAPDEAIRILAGRGGGRHQDADGSFWEGDRYFAGGEIVPTPATIKVRGYDPDLFAAGRRGEFRYDIPLAQGLWELHLFFAETEFGQDNLQTSGEATRDFYVYCNDNKILSDLDIYLDAGDSNTVDEKIFPGVIPAKDGFLHLVFGGLSDLPIVNAIELVRTNAAKMHPLRIVCLRQAHRDRSGAFWGSDRYVRGGVLVARPFPSSWTDPELCRGERFGRFVYDIPVAPGLYTVNLYFTEGWFGTGNAKGSGIGSRRFNVAANDHILLQDFDILKEAGGPYKTVRKSFQHVAAGATGKIRLNFEPVLNYALINAIEIVAE